MDGCNSACKEAVSIDMGKYIIPGSLTKSIVFTIAVWYKQIGQAHYLARTTLFKKKSPKNLPLIFTTNIY